MKERQRRVAEQIQRFLSERLIHETRDPRIGFTTLTGVEISPDLRSARVFVTVYGPGPASAEGAIRVLNEAAGHYRHELGRGLGLRHVPTLQFTLDASIEKADRIERLIRSFHEDEPSAEPAAETIDAPKEQRVGKARSPRAGARPPRRSTRDLPDLRRRDEEGRGGGDEEE